ncbi:NAD-dependent protein deacylase [Bacillus changyiensis]|uniref:NAD-dependent protein deacylase n=1 Tax=Bacillus changyiensis TaxID=3004103 RepID=UPI0022E81274|nr:NAD-dependent protein deacylase [Bacillus changyiensis]MDA1476063.1 NAD-dependent protein deacylase [Bacillus changyiensis]
MQGEAEKFIGLLEKAQHITVLTGAGMSTESGIPDFRSAGGIWTEDTSRMEAMSRDYFERYPKLFWPKFKELFQLKMSDSFQPNAGHRFLAELEKQGKDVNVFTQNIDGLHIEAGSQHVYELHGTLQTATCPTCGTQYGRAEMLQEEIPKCCQCRFILKPDVVLFGDIVQHLDTLFQVLNSTDLLLVIGTSLEVAPVRFVPEEAHMIPGLKKIMINLDETAYDQLFDLVIHRKIAEFISELNRFPI